MRLLLLSDLHLEFKPFDLPRVPGVDVCVLAGDMCTPMAIPRLRRMLRGWKVPTVVIHGNHDLWHDVVEREMVAGPGLRDALADLGGEFHVLDCTYVDIGGLRFFGGTMWTDFRLYGTTDESKRIAERTMRDFEFIGMRDGARVRRLTPEDMVDGWGRFRREAIKAIESAPGGVVMVSHFLPSRHCVDPQFYGSDVNPYFASSQLDLFGGKVKLWCLGHTHVCMDFDLDRTRVVCNPRGYPGENPDFDARRVIEV